MAPPTSVNRSAKQSATPEDRQNGIAKLPGSAAPEIEVFKADAVKALFAAGPYNISIDVTLAGVKDHHAFGGCPASRRS